MDSKIAIKKLIISLVLLVMLSSCTKDSPDYVVVDQGNDQYILVKGIDGYYKALKIKGDQIIFSVDDITVNKHDVYTYKDIDPDSFWNYIVNKQELDIGTKPLIFEAVRYKDKDPIGAEFIFFLDNNDDNWLVYSYSGVIKKSDEYYSFTFKEDGELLDQTFSNKMAAFAEQYYSKSKWTTDKMKKWLELNGFAY